MARYNALGEWKPYTADGDEARAKSAAGRLAGDALDVYGALFYVFFTGHQVLEFAAVASLELPTERLDLADGRLHLWRCPPLEPLQDEIVYDGWWEFPAASRGDVHEALQTIAQVLNRVAFTFNATIQWRQKYTPLASAGSIATPQPEDLPLLEEYARLRATPEENAVLDAAMDWYARARLAQNSFTTFLSYYIPIETVAVAAAAGIADFGMTTPRLTKHQRRAAREACVRSLHDEAYATDPAAFVRRAYFDCLQSVRAQVRIVLEHVFGKDGAEVSAVLDDASGTPSLMSLRGRIAHGSYSLSDPTHVAEVRDRTPGMARVSRSFLARLILQLAPDEPLPTWSGRRRASISVADPRDIHIASDVLIRSRDWRIRPAWCKS